MCDSDASSFTLRTTQARGGGTFLVSVWGGIAEFSSRYSYRTAPCVRVCVTLIATSLSLHLSLSRALSLSLSLFLVSAATLVSYYCTNETPSLFHVAACRCLENVKDGKSVAPSLRLMQRIIDAQPEGSAGSWSDIAGGGGGGGLGGARNSSGVARKDEILETLDRDFDLLALLVDVSFVKPLSVSVDFLSVFVGAVGLCLSRRNLHESDGSDPPFNPRDSSGGRYTPYCRMYTKYTYIICEVCIMCTAWGYVSHGSLSTYFCRVGIYICVASLAQT